MEPARGIERIRTRVLSCGTAGQDQLGRLSVRSLLDRGNWRNIRVGSFSLHEWNSHLERWFDHCRNANLATDIARYSLTLERMATSRFQVVADLKLSPQKQLGAQQAVSGQFFGRFVGEFANVHGGINPTELFPRAMVFIRLLRLHYEAREATERHEPVASLIQEANEEIRVLTRDNPPLNIELTP